MLASISNHINLILDKFYLRSAFLQNTRDDSMIKNIWQLVHIHAYHALFRINLSFHLILTFVAWSTLYSCVYTPLENYHVVDCAKKKKTEKKLWKIFDVKISYHPNAYTYFISLCSLILVLYWALSVEKKMDDFFFMIK